MLQLIMLKELGGVMQMDANTVVQMHIVVNGANYKKVNRKMEKS